MSKLTPKTEQRTYTDEEKRAWVEQQKKERHRLAVQSRDWIREAGLAEKSLLTCGTHSTYKQTATYKAYEDGSNMSEHIARCKSKWSCPECSYLELWKSSQEIKKLLLALAREGGYTVILQTLTAPHYPGQPLRQQMKNFSEGYSHFLNSKTVKRLKREYGYIGNIRVYDHTVKNRGGLADWHTHLHNLWIFKGDITEDSFEWEDITGSMVEQWKRSHDLNFNTDRHVSEQAIDHERVELSDDVAIVDYVAKVVSTYITKTEKNEQGIYAPFDLLSGDPDTEDFRKSCWLDYVQEVKGYKRINWSTGLKRKFPEVVYVPDSEYDPNKTARELMTTDPTPSLFDNPAERIAFAYYPSPDELEIYADDPNAKAILLRALSSHDVELLRALMDNMRTDRRGFISTPHKQPEPEPDYTDPAPETYYNIEGCLYPYDVACKLWATSDDDFIEYYAPPRPGEQGAPLILNTRIEDSFLQ